MSRPEPGSLPTVCRHWNVKKPTTRPWCCYGRWKLPKIRLPGRNEIGASFAAAFVSFANISGKTGQQENRDEFPKSITSQESAITCGDYDWIPAAPDRC